jgi:hypothetical protein
MRQHDARRFVKKAIFLGGMFYAATLLLSLVFSQAYDWRYWQDPRKRLLYEPVPGTVDVILLGDSVWTSSYVQSAAETLWGVVRELTGKHVYNATLNGADPPDFLNAVRLFPDRTERRSLVFLNVVPTRLLHRTFVEPAAGNYAGDFSTLTGSSAVRSAFVFLRRPLMIFNTEMVLNCLLRKKHFSVGDHRDRVWSDDGAFALNRFRTFERYVVDTDQLKRPDWIKELDVALERKGYGLVVVVTPVNRFLIRKYATPQKAAIYEWRIARAREALLQFLHENHIPYVDCSEVGDSDSFADLLHTNARGDRRMAEAIADYLAHPPSAR